MIDQKIKLKVLSLAAVSAFIINPGQALAWGGQPDWHRDRDSRYERRHSHRNRHFRHNHHNNHNNHHHRHHHQRHYPRHGSIVFDLPFGTIKVVTGGKRYYYCDGVFYKKSNFDYVVIPPPSGAVVTVLPVGIQPVMINGVTYYTNAGVYYQHTSQGYVVVPQPQVTVIEAAKAVHTISNKNSETNSEDSFTVNVANSKGGYTAVALKRSGDGFIGPQGEYYAAFPKVEQLRIMYGK